LYPNTGGTLGVNAIRVITPMLTAAFAAGRLDLCPSGQFAHADPQTQADSEQVNDSDVMLPTFYAAK
jgi:hypothetical protein